jgi:low affinity Fe/Cu permease
MELLRRALTQLGVLTATPAAFAIVALYAALWGIFQFETFDWHALATMATWFMTLLIQRAEHRDTQAIHAKLDELIHAHGGIGNATTRLDEQQPEDIERFRERSRKDD